MQLRVVPFLFLAVCSACGEEDARVIQTETQQTQTEAQRPPPREGPEGCYIPARTMCDCAIAEADCGEDVGVWTEGCATCATP